MTPFFKYALVSISLGWTLWEALHLNVYATLAGVVITVILAVVAAVE